MLKRSICVKSHGALVSFVNRLDVGEVDKIGVVLLLKTKLKETNLVLFKRWPETILLHAVVVIATQNLSIFFCVFVVFVHLFVRCEKHC